MTRLDWTDLERGLEKRHLIQAELRKLAQPEQPEPLPKRVALEPEGRSWAWALAGIACLVGSASVVCAAILALVMQLGPEKQKYLVNTLLMGGILIVGTAAICEALYQMEKDK